MRSPGGSPAAISVSHSITWARSSPRGNPAARRTTPPTPPRPAPPRPPPPRPPPPPAAAPRRAPPAGGRAAHALGADGHVRHRRALAHGDAAADGLLGEGVVELE